MRSLRYILGVWLVVGAGACGLFPGDETRERSTPTPEAVHRLFDVAFSVERDATLTTLQEMLGSPSEIRSEGIPNHHRPGQIDSLRTMRYDGITVQLYETYPAPGAGQGMRSFLIRLELLDETFSSPDGLSVGDSTEQLQNLLGDPYHEENHTWYYALGEDESVQLEANVEQDQVQRLTWHFIVD